MGSALMWAALCALVLFVGCSLAAPVPETPDDGEGGLFTSMKQVPVIWIVVVSVAFILSAVSLVIGCTCKACQSGGKVYPDYYQNHTLQLRNAVMQARMSNATDARTRMEQLTDAIYHIGVRADSVLQAINSLETRTRLSITNEDIEMAGGAQNIVQHLQHVEKENPKKMQFSQMSLTPSGKSVKIEYDIEHFEMGAADPNAGDRASKLFNCQPHVVSGSAAVVKSEEQLYTNMFTAPGPTLGHVDDGNEYMIFNQGRGGANEYGVLGAQIAGDEYGVLEGGGPRSTIADAQKGPGGVEFRGDPSSAGLPEGGRSSKPNAFGSNLFLDCDETLYDSSPIAAIPQTIGSVGASGRKKNRVKTRVKKRVRKQRPREHKPAGVHGQGAKECESSSDAAKLTSASRADFEDYTIYDEGVLNEYGTLKEMKGRKVEGCVGEDAKADFDDYTVYDEGALNEYGVLKDMQGKKAEGGVGPDSRADFDDYTIYDEGDLNEYGLAKDAIAAAKRNEGAVGGEMADNFDDMEVYEEGALNEYGLVNEMKVSQSGPATAQSIQPKILTPSPKALESLRLARQKPQPCAPQTSPGGLKAQVSGPPKVDAPVVSQSGMSFGAPPCKQHSPTAQSSPIPVISANLPSPAAQEAAVTSPQPLPPEKSQEKCDKTPGSGAIATDHVGDFEDYYVYDEGQLNEYGVLKDMKQKKLEGAAGEDEKCDFDDFTIYEEGELNEYGLVKDLKLKKMEGGAGNEMAADFDDYYVYDEGMMNDYGLMKDLQKEQKPKEGAIGADMKNDFDDYTVYDEGELNEYGLMKDMQKQ